MSKEKHTPKPWRIGDSGAVVADVPLNPDPAGVNHYDNVKAYGGFLIAETVAPQNRDLIAAAPELCEALANIENDDGRIPPAIWALRNEALAKARGEGVPPALMTIGGK